MNTNERILRIKLAGFRDDKIQQFFEKRYLNHLYSFSDAVTYKGKEIKGSEKAVLLLPEKDYKARTGTVKTSNNHKGIILNKEMFIRFEIETFEKLIKDTDIPFHVREKAHRYIEYLKHQSKPESIPAGKMDLSKLDRLFKPTFEEIKDLKEDIETNLPAYNKKQIVALASIIYNSKNLHPTIKPEHFSKWIKMFCEIIDKDVPTTKESTVNKEITEMKNTYYYL